MSELTAAEWNERHPPGSVVWYPTTDGPRLGMQWGIAADEFDDYGQFDNGPGVVLGRISSGLSDKIAPPFPLADLEPVATDEQRRAEGWLDPQAATAEGMRLVREHLAETDRLRRERDSLARRCAVRYEETEKLKAELERRDRMGVPVYHDPAAVTLTPGGRYQLVGPDGVWVVTGLSTAGDTAELHLHREPQPPCPECGPDYRLGDEGCRHG